MDLGQLLEKYTTLSVVWQILIPIFVLLFAALFGIVAGYFGGWVDAVISRIMDLLLAFPQLLFIIALVSVMPNDMLGLTGSSVRVFVMIMGAIALYSSLGESGGVANATHLGGLAVGYLFLKSGRIHPLSELKYRYLKWKINRVRKKFDVYSGGRADDWDRRVH